MGERFGGWPERHSQKCGMMKLKFTMLQLHKNGHLNKKSVAALLVNALPLMTSLVTEHPEMIDENMEIRPLLEDLKVLVASTEGLEHCQELAGSVSEQKALPSEAVLQLL